MKEPTVTITKNNLTNEPLSTTKTEPQTIVQTTQSTFPTNAVELPSKGLLYAPDSILRQGYVELKFMTAREENILTTESYIKQGIVIDKFLQSMLITKFNYDDLLIGDKDALIVASRIYGYGEKYEVEVTAPSGKKQKVEIDLTTLTNKELDETLYSTGENEFSYQFENRVGKYDIRFKLLTVGDQRKIDEKLKKYKTVGSADTQITTRLEHLILSVNGETDSNFIKMFINNEFQAKDARLFREYVAKVTPGVNMQIELLDEETSEPFLANVTIQPNFFWPDI